MSGTRVLASGGGGSGCIVIVTCMSCGDSKWTWMPRERAFKFKRLLEAQGLQVSVICGEG